MAAFPGRNEKEQIENSKKERNKINQKYSQNSQDDKNDPASFILCRQVLGYDLFNDQIVINAHAYSP